MNARLCPRLQRRLSEQWGRLPVTFGSSVRCEEAERLSLDGSDGYVKNDPSLLKAKRHR
jgi:hypothetical protein